MKIVITYIHTCPMSIPRHDVLAAPLKLSRRIAFSSDQGLSASSVLDSQWRPLKAAQARCRIGGCCGLDSARSSLECGTIISS